MKSVTRIGLGAAFAVGALIGAVTIGPARATIEAAMNCASFGPCLEWDNSKGGVGVKGVSSGGAGLEGFTKFNSTGKSAGKAGVVGQDTSTSGALNSGVSGLSVNGAGVTGTSTNLNGVQGFSASGASGVYGQNSVAGGFGVAGRNTSSTHNSNSAGVLADGSTASDALHAFAYGSNANAVYAFAQHGTALFANQGPNASAPEVFVQGGSGSLNDMIEAVDASGSDIFAVTSQDGTLVTSGFDAESGCCKPAGEFTSSGSNPVVWMFAGEANTSDYVMSAFDANDAMLMNLDDSGNLKISGLLTTAGACHSGCVVGGKRTRSVSEYSALESEPTVEDTGDAVLMDGIAQVALDPSFSNVIDTNAGYRVFVTPDGDCRGLYVASRSPGGFIVRELQGGRSNVPFEYRIVAKRFGVAAQRLPMVTAARAVRSRHARTMRPH
ncbi:MAG TPA: hypothetical protein VKT51_11470 [Candidatus Eremiobacteraceae bacterium]|nr:hypothetical protein [Candidatus Eremiobacteraceae bacterium]